MGEINISRSQKDALAAIDPKYPDKRVDLAIKTECAGDLYLLRLDVCGPYVWAKLGDFGRALADHSQAKAPRKRAQTGDELQRAGHRLTSAVRQMKRRLEEEEKEGQLFHIDDNIMHPLSFLSDELSVRITYRWRKSIEAEWIHGSIAFTHVVDKRPDFRLPALKRKPNAAKREQDLQSKRYKGWEDLMRGALYSMRDFLRSGGEGSTIPKTFRAVVDESGFLNNNSTQFWQKPPQA